VENDNPQEQKPIRENDSFSKFMFGNRKHKDSYEVEDNSQEFPKQKEQSSIANRTGRMDDWFFGSGRKESSTTTHTTHTSQDKIENLLNNVDINLLMETIDMFVATSKQFKPLIKEITPVLNKFSKKFKSNKDD
jgi:hypothetical protein